MKRLFLGLVIAAGLVMPAWALPPAAERLQRTLKDVHALFNQRIEGYRSLAVSQQTA